MCPQWDSSGVYPHLDPKVKVLLQEVNLMPSLVLPGHIHKPILEDHIPKKIQVNRTIKREPAAHTQERMATHVSGCAQDT